MSRSIVRDLRLVRQQSDGESSRTEGRQFTRTKLRHRRESPGRRRWQVVYLAAPIPAYETPAYDGALAWLQERYPQPPHILLSARGMWRDSDHWRWTYRSILAPVTRLYLLVHQGRVGPGVWEEWRHLTQDRGLRDIWAFRGEASVCRVSRLVAGPEGPLGFPYSALVLDDRGKAVH